MIYKLQINFYISNHEINTKQNSFMDNPAPCDEKLHLKSWTAPLTVA